MVPTQLNRISCNFSTCRILKKSQSKLLELISKCYIEVPYLHAGLFGLVREAECHVLFVVSVQLRDDEGVAHHLEEVQDEERTQGHLVKYGHLFL